SSWINSKSFNCNCFNYKTLLLIKYIYLNKPDVIYIIGFRLSIFLRFFCKIFAKNILIQGVRWNPNTKSKLDRAFRIFESHFSFLLDGYIVNSTVAGKLVSSFTDNNVKVIHNGISISTKKDTILTKKNYVITIANLSLRKGYKEYIKVIGNIVKKVPNTQFLFLGNDNLNGQVQKIIEKEGLTSNISYLGFHEDVGVFLKQSSIFVLPSLYGEGCPTSILEAFSYSLPVVAYNIDGIPELVSHNHDGILVDIKGNYTLEEAIISLLLNPDRAKNMGNKGNAKVHEKFLMDNMLKKHNSFFMDLK
ncbi:glycosyltransferase family 4 protein, partial [Candidatus Pseudothioglobus singularis]|nr:glycosyltransferase family 4 protein [Candidatus Pseudothioglobus singularis]